MRPHRVDHQGRVRRAAHPQRVAPVAACGLLAWGLLATAGAAHSQTAAEARSWEHKLTLGRYANSDGTAALDLNWRVARGAHTGWIGQYEAHERDGLRQARFGYEWRQAVGRSLRAVWSLQGASGGAKVGSVGAEVGEETFAIVGFGRTNRRPYVNLNFDPNDMVTLGLGTRAWPGVEASVFQVRDDRLGTGQRVTHAVLRWRISPASRLTVDASRKQGRLEDGSYGRGPGLSLGYDHADLFIRLARDRHAGFAVADQTRVSVGLRF